MQRVTGIRRSGDWDASPAADRVVLDAGERHLRRVVLRGEGGGKIRIRRDHVLEEMLRGLGAQLTPLDAAFDPEASIPHGHGHDHE